MLGFFSSMSADHMLATRCSISICVSLSALEITSRASLPLLFKKSWHSGGRKLWAHLTAFSHGLLWNFSGTSWTHWQSRDGLRVVWDPAWELLALAQLQDTQVCRKSSCSFLFLFTPCISPTDLRVTLWPKHFVLFRDEHQLTHHMPILVFHWSLIQFLIVSAENCIKKLR